MTEAIMVAETVDTNDATPVVTVPAQVTLTLDQLLDAIRQLDEPGRVKVARVLKKMDLDSRLDALTAHLAAKEPADDMTDEEINEEVSAVRRERMERRHVAASH